MTGWTLVEPCCGTAALTLHLLGGRRQLVPRQGSKWAIRRELGRLLERLGFAGRPDRIVLTDASPWPVVLGEVLMDRSALLDQLRPLVAEGERDPRAVYDRLNGAEIPGLAERQAAELLWLQRMSYAGKAVRTVADRWVSPGLNLTSAYGVEGTDRFGAVRPLGSALLEVVERAPRAMVETQLGLARPTGPAEGTLVYLDPPYAGTTGYGAELSRDEVVELALDWAGAGATVIVSEASAVAELVEHGWSAALVAEIGDQRATQLFRTRHRSEWVTWTGAVQLELPWAGRAA